MTIDEIKEEIEMTEEKYRELYQSELKMRKLGLDEELIRSILISDLNRTPFITVGVSSNSSSS